MGYIGVITHLPNLLPPSWYILVVVLFVEFGGGGCDFFLEAVGIHRGFETGAGFCPSNVSHCDNRDLLYKAKNWMKSCFQNSGFMTG